MNFIAHITGKAKSVKHSGQIVEVDRELDGDSIICFALRDVSADETMIGMVANAPTLFDFIREGA